VVIDVAIPGDSNIYRKEHEKHQGLTEEVEEIVPVVTAAVGA